MRVRVNINLDERRTVLATPLKNGGSNLLPFQKRRLPAGPSRAERGIAGHSK